MQLIKLWISAVILLMTTSFVACANGTKTEAASESESESASESEAVVKAEKDYSNEVKSFFADYVYGPKELNSKMFSDELTKRVKAEYAEWVANDSRLSDIYSAAFGVDNRYDYEVKDVRKLGNGWYKVIVEGCYMGYGGDGSTEEQITYVKVAPNTVGNTFIIEDITNNEADIKSSKDYKDYSEDIKKYYKEIVYAEDYDHAPIYSVMTDQLKEQLANRYAEYFWDGIGKYDVIDIAFGLCIDGECPYSPYKLTNINIVPLGKGWYKVVAEWKGEHYDAPGNFKNGRSEVNMKLEDSPNSKYGFKITELTPIDNQ